MLRIISAPNPILTQKTKPIIVPSTKIVRLDKPIRKLIDEMKQALANARDPEGVGLAAPQVGRSLQLFIIKPMAKSVFQTFINPEVKLMTPATQISEKIKTKNTNPPKKLEGCLSLRNIWGEILRSDKVIVKYFDEEGRFHQRTFEGFPATIVQHEYDHLHGILFPKRVLEQNGKLYKSHKDKKGKDVFEEMEI